MRKLTLFIASVLMSIGTAWADDLYTGLLVTSPSGKVTYALSEMPKIVYVENSTTSGAMDANIFTKDRKSPVVTITLQEGQSLKTEWGTYSMTGIDGVKSENVTTFEKNGHKYFTGGKLVIIGKDGKLYDAAGKQIK